MRYCQPKAHIGHLLRQLEGSLCMHHPEIADDDDGSDMVDVRAEFVLWPAVSVARCALVGMTKHGRRLMGD